MNRQEYNSCISIGLKGKKLSKEERKTEFCVTSKLCSKKAKTREEALKLCAMPKEEKIIDSDINNTNGDIFQELTCPDIHKVIIESVESAKGSLHSNNVITALEDINIIAAGLEGLENCITDKEGLDNIAKKVRSIYKQVESNAPKQDTITSLDNIATVLTKLS
jgi:hypothetical protein